MALFDAFLKLDGIKGESADARHKGEIDVMSFSWGLSQTGVSATGGGGGAGKVHVHDFTIVKRSDAASPLLMLNCASGAHIKEATFTVRKAGGEQLEYLKIKLSDVLVSSHKSNGAVKSFLSFRFNTVFTTKIGWETGDDGPTEDLARNSGEEIPLEQITLNFAKIEFSYQPQGADGKAQGGPILAGWDVKGNVKV